MEDIISREKYRQIKEERDRLKTENDEMKGRYRELESEYNEKCTELDEMYCYSGLEQIYRGYCRLSSDIKKSLSNVICADTAVDFLISAGQWKNIETLWDNISYRLDDTPDDDLKNMINVFEWLFDKYNDFNGEYSLLKVRAGDTFDSDFHSKGSRSAVSGEIKEVLLRGYKNNINGKILKKSIVRI